MGAQRKHRKKPNFDARAFRDESSVHEVYLDEFRIARYLTSVGQYVEFVEHGGYDEECWWKHGGFGKFDTPARWEQQVEFPNRPVVGVCWFEASAYCEWAKCRLPTEAEWERAASGTEGRVYPWGEEIPVSSRLNYGNNLGHPTPVGIFPVSRTPEKVCDMAGNVWEWCADWYGEYASKPASNPRGPTKGTGRVRRGGSWALGARRCRSAYRRWSKPGSRGGRRGFRAVLLLPGK